MSLIQYGYIINAARIPKIIFERERTTCHFPGFSVDLRYFCPSSVARSIGCPDLCLVAGANLVSTPAYRRSLSGFPINFVSTSVFRRAISR